VGGENRTEVQGLRTEEKIKAVMSDELKEKAENWRLVAES